MKRLAIVLVLPVFLALSATAQPRLQITYGLAGSGVQSYATLFNTTSPYIGINLGYDWNKNFVESGVEYYAHLADTLEANTLVFPLNYGSILRTEPALIYLGFGYGFRVSQVYDPDGRSTYYNTHSFGVVFNANIRLGENSFLTLRYRGLTDFLTNYPDSRRFLSDMSSLSIGLSSYLFRKKKDSGKQ